MVPFRLSQVIGDTNTEYTSEHVQALSEDALVYVAVSDGTLVVNGVALAGQSSMVAANSHVAVRLKSSAVRGETVYATLTIEDRASTFVLTSSVQGQLVYDTNNKTLPLDFYATSDYLGDDAWDLEDSPLLHRMSNGLQWSASIDLTQTALGRIQQRDYLFVVNRWADQVFRVDVQASVIEQKIELPSPVAVARVGQNQEGAPIAYHFYVLLEEGRIARLSAENNYASPSEYIQVGTKPSDILGVDNVLWVANSESDTVDCITVDASTLEYGIESIPLPTGSKPAQIRDLGNYVYVTLYLSNAVAKIHKTLHSVEILDVGYRPYGLSVFGTSLYCVCSGDKTLWSITDLGAIGVLDSTVSPTFVHATATGYLVLDVEGRKAVEFDVTLQEVRTFEVSSPIELLSHEGQNYLFANVGNAQSRRTGVDFKPESFEFLPSMGNDKGTTSISNGYIVRGVNAPVFLSQSPDSSSVLHVNGVAVEDAWVTNGDTIKVHTVNPDAYGARTETMVTLGSETTTFVATTVDQDAIPSSIIFQPLNNVPEFTQQTSNVVTITGMKDGLTISAFAENGTLVHNGVEVVGAVEIQNGDTVALKVTSLAFNEWTSATLRTGPISATFSVNTLGDPFTDLDLSFTDRGDIPIGEMVESNKQTVPSPTLDQPIELIDVYGGTLIVNDIDVGQSATVSAGDTIAIRQQVTSAYGIAHVQTINSCGFTYRWLAETEPDNTPYHFAFTTVRDKNADEEVLSEIRTLDGMDLGAVGNAMIFPEADVLVNGERINTKDEYSPIEAFSFSVVNGDTIQIAGRAGSPFGTGRRYVLTIGKMETSFSVFSRPVDGAYENPYNQYIVENQSQGFVTGQKTVAQPTPITFARRLEGTRLTVDGREVDITGSGTPSLFVGPAPDRKNLGTSVEQVMPDPQRFEPIKVVAGQQGFERREPIKQYFDGPDASRNEPIKVVFDGPGTERYDPIRKYFDRPAVNKAVIPRHTFDRPTVDKVVAPHHTFARPSVVSYVKNMVQLDSGVPYVVRQHRPDLERFGFEQGAVPHAEYLETPWKTAWSHVDYRLGMEYEQGAVPSQANLDILGFDMPPTYTRMYEDAAYRKDRKSKDHPFAPLDPTVVLSGPYSELIDTLPFGQNPSSYQTFDSMQAEETILHMSIVYIDREYEAKSTNSLAHVYIDHEYERKGSASLATMFVEGVYEKAGTPIFEFIPMETDTIHSSHVSSVFDLTPLITPRTHRTVSPMIGEVQGWAYHEFDSMDSTKHSPGHHPFMAKEAQPAADNKFTVQSGGTIQRSFTVSNAMPEKRGFERNSNEVFEDTERKTLTPDLMKYAANADEAYQWALDKGVDPSRIQTHELYPNCWVWAEVLDQPNWCEDIPEHVAESGWIQGG